jgi:serine phosphatase RsbU (regulator of sigma subunit)
MGYHVGDSADLGATRRHDDRRRSQAMESIGIRPNSPSERLDHITGIAQQMFGVAMAAVTLLDQDRQWFKSRRGIDVEWLPREVSFCDAAVENAEGLVVEDLSKDARFRDNPLVAGEQRIRFYAGHPISVPGGPPLGTLCLIDRRFHTFGAHERELLGELARAVEEELGHSDEMQRAAQVQRSLLPAASPEVPGWEFAGTCKPSRAVGGDFLDWYHQDDGRLVLTFADVMGKGVGAGIVAATVRAAMRTAGRTRRPSDAIAVASAALDEDLQQTGSLVTLLHARLDPATGDLDWVDAGHGLVMIVRADGTVQRRSGGDMPLGVLPGDNWVEQSFRFRPGDMTFAFSDGLLDLYDGTMAALTDIERVARDAGEPEALVQAFLDIAGDRPLPDDLTIHAIRRLP